MRFLVLRYIGQNLPDLASEFYSDGFTVSDVCIVIVHLCQGHHFFEKLSRCVVAVMIDQLPWLRNVATRIGAEIRHVTHGVEEMRLAIHFAKSTPQRRIRAHSEKPDASLLDRKKVMFLNCLETFS